MPRHASRYHAINRNWVRPPLGTDRAGSVWLRPPASAARESARVGVPSRDADGGEAAGGVVRRERQRQRAPRVLLRLHRCHNRCAAAA
jgi:hypothetical protein